MVEQNLPPFVQAVYRNTTYQFWVLQLVGWFGLCLISFVSLTLWYNQQTFAYIAHTLLQSVLGILVSWPLRPLFHYFWNKSVWSRFTASIVGVLVCSIIWTMLRITTFMSMTGEQGLWNDFGGWLFGSIMIFSCWAAFYYGVKFYQLLQFEHATLLRIAAENKEQQLRRSQAEAIAHEAQLKMLRYQLNPHFLFNTLNAIAALVATKEMHRASAMIVQLSDFLRYSLDNDPVRRVTLKEEMDALKLYLNIEQTRFAERLELEFDIDPSSEDARIPSLILQPLVENAIKYAIAPMEEGGKISVLAALDNEYVQIEMLDTGPGMQSDDAPLEGIGIGLKNTVDRLHEFYGDNYTFNLESGASGGLKVFMRLPLEKQSR
ncbi:MAG: histidine kinase [Porticoccaceae bacterium]|jgi:sensor histidine kinase YesM|nr:histidine kinase [Porticoccaceae bacterium]